MESNEEAIARFLAGGGQVIRCAGTTHKPEKMKRRRDGVPRWMKKSLRALKGGKS
jgi:hypothetical protein